MKGLSCRLLSSLVVASLFSAGARGGVASARKISVAVVTWNMAAKSPSLQDCRFLKELADGFDVVVVGCQEIEDVKPRRVEGHRSRYWYTLTKKIFGKKKGFCRFWRFASGGVQILVASKARCALESSSDVACGVGNVLRNKGAVCAFVEFDGGAKFSFVSAHMAAHGPKVAERNADYARIAAELPIDDENSAVFFCGDLNYRLQGLTRSQVEAAVDDGRLSELFDDFDQLTRERAANRVFHGFVEARPNFKPTFKYDRFSDSYDTSHKRRVPAWTDRVLFTPSPGISLTKYTDLPVRHSDHRPVLATFTVDTEIVQKNQARNGRRRRRRPRMPRRRPPAASSRSREIKAAATKKSSSSTSNGLDHLPVIDISST